VTLVVSVEEVARRLKLPQPLEESDRWLIEQAIVDAQSDLEAYLGRPVVKGTYTQQHLLRYCSGWNLPIFPVHEIVSETPETQENGQPTGYWTVVYEAGLDGKADPELEPIRRFVKAHALYSPLVQSVYRRLDPEGARKVASLGVEGQTVTYGDTFATEARASELGLPGGLPAMKSCDRWRIAGRMVHQAPTQVNSPWPFEDPYMAYHWHGQWWA
jgi:hypothetical protein